MVQRMRITISVTKLLYDAINDESNGKFSLLYWNKKEATTLLQRAGLQLPGSLIPRDGFIHSIRENASPVNPKFENVTQSQQFKRWFGDWKNHPENASKIVNADGTPKVVYHQTDRDFTVFDNSTPVAGKNGSETPNGFFFKDIILLINIKSKNTFSLFTITYYFQSPKAS